MLSPSPNTTPHCHTHHWSTQVMKKTWGKHLHSTLASESACSCGACPMSRLHFASSPGDFGVMPLSCSSSWHCAQVPPACFNRLVLACSSSVFHNINRKRKISCSSLQLRRLPWEDLFYSDARNAFRKDTKEVNIIGHTAEDTSDQKAEVMSICHYSSFGFSELWIRFHMNWLCLVLTSVGHFLVHMSLNTQTGLSMLGLHTIQRNPASLNLLRLASERNVGDLQFMGRKPQAAGCREHTATSPCLCIRQHRDIETLS